MASANEGKENHAFDGKVTESDFQKKEKDQEDEEISRKEDVAAPSRRKIIIEPALAMCVMFQITSYSLTAQYHYYAISERFNLFELIRNHSEVNGSRNDCGGLERNKSSPAYIAQQDAQAATARFNFYLDLIIDVPGLFILLFFGTLIDRLGRKPGMIISMSGMIFRIALYIIQQAFPIIPLEIIFLSGIVEACTGGFATFLTSCYALLVDNLLPIERGKRLAFADAANGICLGVMSYLMGVMIDKLGFMWPLFVILGGHIINLLYVIFFVEESTKPIAKKRSISPKYIIDCFKILARKRLSNGRALLALLIICWTTMFFAKYGSRSIETIYKLNTPFCWSSTTLGAVTGLSAFLANFVQILVAVFLLKRLGTIGLIYIGMVSNTLEFLTLGLATKSWMLYLAPVLGSGAALPYSFMRGIMSAIVEKREQGALFASLTALEKVSGVAASSFYNFVYGATLDVMKGIVFLVMSGLMVVAIIQFLIYHMLYRKTAKEPEANIEREDEVAAVTKDGQDPDTQFTKF